MGCKREISDGAKGSNKWIFGRPTGKATATVLGLRPEVLMTQWQP